MTYLSCEDLRIYGYDLLVPVLEQVAPHPHKKYLHNLIIFVKIDGMLLDYAVPLTHEYVID
jgi:hypothetical protein